jgi:hypothetical protein
MITDRPRMETVVEYVARGNEAQIGDEAFVGELRNWIRFNKADAARTRDVSVRAERLVAYSGTSR